MASYSEIAKNWFQNTDYYPSGIVIRSWGAAGLQQHGQDEMLPDVRRCSSFLSLNRRSSQL